MSRLSLGGFFFNGILFRCRRRFGMEGDEETTAFEESEGCNCGVGMAMDWI